MSYKLPKELSALSVLFALTITCAPIAAPAAMASGLPASTQIKETSLTGHRTAATTLDISLGAGITGSLDVGTGNLQTSMNVDGISFTHNSLTP